jgi:iron complex outermembrane receptor protein
MAAGRIVDGSGTGWNTFAAKGVWRPLGRAAHVVEFGYQREAYKLRQHRERDRRLDQRRARRAQRRPSAAAPIDPGLYAQDTWRFAPRWKAVLGLRATSAGRRERRPHLERRTTVAHPAAHGTYASPKAALAYQATPDWVLKASLGRAVRMPTVSELYQGGVNAASAC